MLQRDNQSAKVPNNVLFNQTPLDSQSVCGCNVCQHKWTLQHWHWLRLLTMMNFERIWLAKRKPNWHAARDVNHCPTLPPSAIWHLLNLLVLRISVTHCASASCSEAVSNTVHWTATHVITAYWKKLRLPAKTSIPWTPTKEAARWTQVTIPRWRPVTTAFLW